MAGGRDTATGHALRALAHPLAVGCLVLLVLNDHVLKQAWPGWVTGKIRCARHDGTRSDPWTCWRL